MAAVAGIEEPYPSLNGGSYSGPAVRESPDPLVSYRWSEVRAKDGLQIYTLLPRSVEADPPGAFSGAGSAKHRHARITVRGAGSLRFDFGVENAAWLEFDSPDLVGDVEMSVSEYNQPAVVNSGPEHPAKTAKPVWPGTFRLELNRDLYEGVRFGWIHVRKFTQPWHITAVRLVCQTKPVNYEGSFSASDPLLTRIWYSGAYAVRLNLLQDYFGAILMDRGDRISWTGDAHPSQAAALAAFGNWDFIKANLVRTSHADNAIASYSLYWVLSLIDYYRYSGDEAAFDELAPAARQKIANAEKIWEAPPHLGFYGWDERLGAGFENPDNPESQNAYRLLTIRACRELAWAFAARGRANEAAETNGIADRLTRAWRGRDGWIENAGLHVAAEAVTAGLAEESRALWSREFADPVNRLSYSPFNQYFVLQAMARVGMYEDALATVRELWGGQLQYGGTCFFETFRPGWNAFLKPNDPVPNCQAGYTSLCHPWSSGVTKWLQEETLGIKPVRPGFAEWAVEPHLGATLTRVRGTTPTPRGPLSVDLDAAKGSMVVEAPAGTLGTVAIPKLGREIRSITADGTVAGNGVADASFVQLKGVAPGRHVYRIVYDRPVVATEAQPAAPSYPARLVAEASGPFGRDGSVLFSAAENGDDVSRLPEYVAEVTHRSARTGPGYLMTGNPKACQQTMTVDVRLKAGHAYRMALHMVVADRQDRRLAVELFDLETKKLIAPVALVSDFAGGKYLVYEYNRSCRVRLDHVRGGDAVISGVYFDSQF